MESLETRQLLTSNPIVLENLLPGTPESQWQVAGVGDTAIEGYTTDISVNHGETIFFKINDTTLAPYRIDIYRMGYYQGNGARLVATIPSSTLLRQAQPAPLKDPATGLVDAGNWAISGSWQVPASAVSGIYIANIVREDTGGRSQMFFVVRDDSGHSDVLFQTADTTWEAYNDWGGNSLYVGESQVSPKGSNLPRAVKVSYNRPLSLRDTFGGLGSYNDPLHAEYPMVRWLEANGYNVSYFTDVDTDRRGSELLEHQLFLSNGHDEYWSGQQRTNMEAARDAGINLAFFSGNEGYWKVRYEDSIDGNGTHYRTMVCYKETHAMAKTDPMPGVWTGQWRDPRFGPHDGGKPENALTGQMFSVNRDSPDIGTAMEVPAEFGSMRLWRNTSIANLSPGQTAVLSAGTLGYEWDEDVDNGMRPAGEFNLSSTTHNVPQKLIDNYSGFGAPCSNHPGNAAACGCVVGAESATHNLTLYRADSGAMVFGAGTIQWSWGLDGHHLNGASTPDPRMQQATVNLFADMGVQPQTLQPGLVPAAQSLDVTAPTSTITSPLSGTFVAGAPMTVTGTASDVGGVIGGVELSLDGGFTWHKATGRSNWSYTWTPPTTGSFTLATRAVDDSGNLQSPAIGPTILIGNPSPNPAGLVASYDFNQGSGATLTDKTGNGNNGTILGATWAPGRFGSGLLFNGSSNWVTIPDANSLDLTTGMTLEAWVKPSTPDGFKTIILKERSGGLAYSMYAANDTDGPPAAFLNFGSSSDQTVSGSAVLPLNAWSHLAVTYDGATMSLYANGVLVGSSSFTGSMVSTSGALRLGGNSIWGDFFAGTMDDVRIYNRALSAIEIRNDLVTPIGGTPDAVAPTVSVSAPGNGPTVAGTITLVADAVDNVAISGVKFFADGAQIGSEQINSPYQRAWDTTKVPNGTYVITARATDVAGNFTTSTNLTLTVNNPADATPPSVALVGPHDGTITAGTVVLMADASDNIGVVSIQYKAGAVDVGSPQTKAPYRLAWDTTTFANGTYNVVAVARDVAGNTTTSVIAHVTVDRQPPTVTSKSPAPDVTEVPTTSSIAATFSEAIVFSSLTVSVLDGANNVAAGAVLYDESTSTVRFVPAGALRPSATYTVTLSNAKDAAGNQMSSVSWSFTTAAQVSNATIWSSSSVPAVPSANDVNATEIGVKFRANVGGYITGLRFYRGASNGGTHVGHLWTSTGTLLGSATFTNESATGWQQVDFTNPIAITANTTYVASYYAPTGGYSANANYFATSSTNSGPLTALASGVDGSNGVFRYVVGGGFPTASFNSTNYWVDVVFSTSLPDNTAPTVTSTSPTANATGVSPLGDVTATFSEPISTETLNFTLHDAFNQAIPATVTFNSSTKVATLDPVSALSTSTVYIATISAFDLSGNALAQAPVTWSFTTASQQLVTSTIWSSSSVPSVPATSDANAIEVGVKFRASANGYITAIRFYKGTANTGSHVGHLWTASGTLLATATFTGESGSGWQLAEFASPIPILSGTTYVASYYAPAGHYAANTDYFTFSGVTNGALTALASGVDGPNGVYRYAVGGGFPTLSTSSSNYWVDVTYTDDIGDETPPVISNVDAAELTPGSATITWATEEFADTQVEFGPTTAYGFNSTFSASLSTGHSVQLNGLQPDTLYHYRVQSHDLAGNLAVSSDFTFTTPPAPETVPPAASLNASNLLNATGNTYTFTVTYTDNASMEVSTLDSNDLLVTSANGYSQNATLVSIDDDTDGSPRIATYRIVSPGAEWQFIDNGTYTVSARASQVFDTSGNTLPATSLGSFQISVNDTTPPAITSVASSNVGPSTATITWATNEVADALVEYGTTSSYGASTTLNTLLTQSHTASLSGLLPGAVYHYRVKSRDAAGNLATSGDFTFSTAAASIWSNTAMPATPSANDASAVEIGLKFRASTSGFITGIRFYKGTGNNGTHVAHLWSSAGLLLGSGTFTSESASGWQQVLFANPVAINANTTYIASYYAPTGHYASNTSFFTTAGVTNGALTALANGADGSNGVYRYGTGGGFPTSSFNAANYWVDVLYSTTAIDNSPPTILSTTPAANSTDALASTPISVSFSEPVDANTISLVLRDASNNVVPGSTAYDATTRTATFTPTSYLAFTTSYTLTVGAADTSGNSMSPQAIPFTTGPGTIFSPSAVPVTITANDANPVEIGMKFRSATAGVITGVRFYKGPSNTGTHIGHLWSLTGTLLATVTFAGESASGWQQANFASPVAISANTTYVVSYYAPVARYSATNGYFASTGASNGPLTAPSTGAVSGNGVYRYGTGGGFPNLTSGSSNYWVDIVFADNVAPTVASTTPATGAIGVSVSGSLSAGFAEPVQPATISFVLRDASNNVVSANLLYDVLTRTVTLDPLQDLVAGSSYTATLSGAADLAGNLMSPLSWSFNT
jgi:hypothetical protein